MESTKSAHTAASAISSGATPLPPQRIVLVRRQYNRWVADETLEDYALRFTPRSFRRWSEFRVANTALGAISFLALEAIGGVMMRDFGFTNSVIAILLVGMLIFMSALPIAAYAARYAVDIDLLTRGAGFGYLGSTFTSLVYASFTFIFFAFEAGIMAFALHVAIDMPLWMGYLLCSIVVVPFVTRGITLISRLQAWTQPIWLILLVIPFLYIAVKTPEALTGLTIFPGIARAGSGGNFDLVRCGLASTLVASTAAQIGEQVDFLRFMPEKTVKNRWRWWTAVLSAGPGWIVIGSIKMLGGIVLFYLAMRLGTSVDNAIQPTVMYRVAFSQVFDSPAVALGLTTLFVIVCQLKINVTNAYAGSLAWSNFFSRTTHAHPGRVVWVVFNVLIAVALINVGVFDVLERVLGFYATLAFAWIGALVADLVVNKPIGWSPTGIEFKRANLYDVNPVGFGAMIIGVFIGMGAHAGWFGAVLQAFSAVLSFAAAFVISPMIACLTKGKYYLARVPSPITNEKARTHTNTGTNAGATHTASHDAITHLECCICEKTYEPEDMASCPAYGGSICSLCCSLDARCGDYCKPHGRLGHSLRGIFRRFVPDRLVSAHNRPGHYLLVILALAIFSAGVLTYIVHEEAIIRHVHAMGDMDGALAAIRMSVVLLLVAIAIAICCMALMSESRTIADDESALQAKMLMAEIEAHNATDAELQRAKRVAEEANAAKSRFITSVSHELRTPLNSILGYAQILHRDVEVSERVQSALGVIRRSGDHVVALIDSLLNLARIEAGRFTITPEPLAIHPFLEEIADIFRLQAQEKSIDFSYQVDTPLPPFVRTDRKCISQILINLLGNAVKFTSEGRVEWRISYRNGVTLFDIEDTGPGIPEDDLAHIFQPFYRIERDGATRVGGTGLGLSIALTLSKLMGGDLTVSSVLGTGTRFQLKLFLPATEAVPRHTVKLDNDFIGYDGLRQRVLVIEDTEEDWELLYHLLTPLGFELVHARTGVNALRLAADLQPHLILMDVSLPDVDGWKLSHLMRTNGISDAPILMVSAEAFARGHANDDGITDEDFIVKPIRVDLLLARIGEKLGLTWQSASPKRQTWTKDDADAIAFMSIPEASALNVLREYGALGYVRGILEKLDEIDRLDTRYLVFCSVLREHVKRFDIESFNQALGRISGTIQTC